jgi:nucleoid-associated protein YgaU
VAVAVVVVLVGGLTAVAGRALGAGQGAGRAPAPARYVVRPGDTVWDLARQRVGPEEDPRPMVTAIVEANHLPGAEIIPGMELVVPPAP